MLGEIDPVLREYAVGQQMRVKSNRVEKSRAWILRTLIKAELSGTNPQTAQHIINRGTFSLVGRRFGLLNDMPRIAVMYTDRPESFIGVPDTAQLGITGYDESLVIEGRSHAGIVVCSEEDPRFNLVPTSEDQKRGRFDGLSYTPLRAAKKGDLDYYQAMFKHIINPDIDAEYIKDYREILNSRAALR